MPKKSISARLPNDTKDHLAFKYFALGCLIDKRDLTIDTFKRHALRIGLRPTPDIFYKSQRVAELLKQSELERLCRRRKDGYRINWTQLLELLELPSAAERERFAALAAREKLGCISLRAEIHGMGGWTNGRPGAGRKRREPRSEADAVWRASGEIEQLRVTLVWLMEKREPKKPTTLRRKILGTVKLLESLQKSVDQLVGRKKHPAAVSTAGKRK